MSSFNEPDVGVQRNITRFTIELFLHELAEQHGSPDQWQMAVANSAIAAYQRGEFHLALACISVGEKPPHKRPLLANFAEEKGELSLRNLWGRLVHPSSDSPAAGKSGFSFVTLPGT